jgi:hypothetical protein
MTAAENDETTDAEVLGLFAGGGVTLMQAGAMIPGLLPVLILFLPLLLPLVVLGLVGGIVVGLPYGLWRLSRLMLRPLVRRRATRDMEATMAG